MMGAFREILGAGTFLGFPLFGPGFEPWVILILPPGGFLTLGVILLLLSAFERRRLRRQAANPLPAPMRRAA
jgi:electron transport complex protein RnfE